jgi:hypothetical protein
LVLALAFPHDFAVAEFYFVGLNAGNWRSSVCDDDRMTPRASALCSTLGIRHPIIQSGMSRVAGPELVAAVSNAGGLGILAALRLQPRELRATRQRVATVERNPGAPRAEFFNRDTVRISEARHREFRRHHEPGPVWSVGLGNPRRRDGAAVSRIAAFW